MIFVLFVGGLLLIFVFGKEDWRSRPVGSILLLMGAWKLADYLTKGVLSASWAVWIYRTVLMVFLIVLIWLLVRNRIQKNKTEKQD